MTKQAPSKRFEADLPAKLEMLFQPARYKVAHGGRGSAKSWSCARALLIHAARRRLRVLCTRELQTSIADSVHRLLSDQVETLGLAPYFNVQRQEITGANGSEFIFEGLRHNINKIRSMEGIDICWVEEAEKVSEDSWKVLVPTIRKAGSEIWISFNPDVETDPTYQRFVKSPPPGALVTEVNWDDNPWFPETLRLEKDYLERVDAEAAANIWGGQLRKSSSAAVLRGKWRIDSFAPGEDWDGPYFGADWGFSTDPTTLLKLWVHGTRLYVEHEVYGVGVELDELPAFFAGSDSQAPARWSNPRVHAGLPGALKHTIRADNARPETISHMRRRGFDCVAVDKWAGSVEEGVTFLRSFEEIIIHQRCRHTINEARLWSYKVDRLTGDVLTTLVDGNNHTWDAARYALQPLIRRGNANALDYMRMLAAGKLPMPDGSRSDARH